MADDHRSREDPPGQPRPDRRTRSSPSASTTRRSTRSSSRTAPARSCSAAPSTTARARRSPTRSSRSSAPTPTAPSRARAARSAATTTASPASVARRPPTTGHYEFWTRNPGSIDGEAPFFAVIVFARGLPDKLHTRIYLPEDDDRLAADPLLSSLDAGRARYAHRDAHARRQPAPRHPAAGREGDRVPCLLTRPAASRSRGRPGARVGLLSPVTVGLRRRSDGCRDPRRARHRRGRAGPRVGRASASRRPRVGCDRRWTRPSPSRTRRSTRPRWPRHPSPEATR